MVRVMAVAIVTLGSLATGMAAITDVLIAHRVMSAHQIDVVVKLAASVSLVNILMEPVLINVIIVMLGHIVARVLGIARMSAQVTTLLALVQCSSQTTVSPLLLPPLSQQML
jgi:hypothetical protein